MKRRPRYLATGGLVLFTLLCIGIASVTIDKSKEVQVEPPPTDVVKVVCDPDAKDDCSKAIARAQAQTFDALGELEERITDAVGAGDKGRPPTAAELLTAVVAYCADHGLCIGATGDTGGKGDKGDKGDQGDAGDVGDPGDDGTDGTDGVDGTNGADGADGVDGTNGTDGADGKDGLPPLSFTIDQDGDGNVDLVCSDPDEDRHWTCAPPGP